MDTKIDEKPEIEEISGKEEPATDYHLDDCCPHKGEYHTISEHCHIDCEYWKRVISRIDS